MKPTPLILTMILFAGSALSRAEEAAIHDLADRVLVSEQRPSLMDVPGGGRDSRLGSFWFSPLEWSGHDLRIVSLGLASIAIEGPMALLFSDDETLPGPTTPIRTRRLIQAAPLAKSGGGSAAAHGILRLLRPRIAIRVTPRMPLTSAPTPGRRAAAVEAR